MEKAKRNPLLHKIVSTRFGTLIFSRLVVPLDRIFYTLSGGKSTFTRLGGLPVIYVRTIGAKSGKPREVPLVAVTDLKNPTAFAVIASNFGRKNLPAWYFNLIAHPEVTCLINGQAQAYIAREVEGAEYERFWDCAQDIYMGYSNYRAWASHRRIPIMVLEPVKLDHSYSDKP